MTVYGYARVSTIGQDLETQEIALQKAGCEYIYSEKFTGTTKDRPQLNELMQQLNEGDTMVVTKLDRFARSTKDAIELVTDLYEKGVKVNVLNIGLIDRSTASGKLMFNVFAAFAEFERDMIVERTQEGKAIAKQRPDYKEGRPKQHGDSKLKEAMEMRDKMKWSMKKTAEMTGISLSTLERYARKQRQQALN
ncbi:recombinase family protein [Bacillus sp. FSL R9-9410]|uniref:recombinase family protein n=1 Tax=Bacillus sp. FSL R9-9410 TaxID=2921590 RepID=UPI003100AA17